MYYRYLLSVFVDFVADFDLLFLSLFCRPRKQREIDIPFSLSFEKFSGQRRTFIGCNQESNIYCQADAVIDQEKNKESFRLVGFNCDILISYVHHRISFFDEYVLWDVRYVPSYRMGEIHARECTFYRRGIPDGLPCGEHRLGGLFRL